MWSDADKAFWILQHGKPKFAWIFERNGNIVYRRPVPEPGTTLPPWINSDREEITNKIVGQEANSIWIDEENH